jgi:hypothetical protein
MSRNCACLVMLFAVTLAGCGGGSATRPDADSSPIARYAKALEYPDRLQPVPGDATAMRWRDPAVNMRKYDKLLIERIRVQLDSDSSSIDPTELKALTDYFHQSLTKAISPPYPVDDKAGPGVLRVRITLVDLVSTKPEMSVVVLLTPYATLPDLMGGAAGGGPVGSAPYLGKTAIAVEFIDGETNAVVAEYAETRFGRKYVLDTNQGATTAIVTGATDYLNAFSTWAYAKQAFDQWSAQFRTRLDQLSGRA